MTDKTLSPKSYLNKNVFDNVSNIKKKRKIKDDEFKMIKMEEYEHVINFQYKVSQLKQLCVHHKLRKTGNKEELINRIYNYLKYSLYAIKIQKVYKGRILRSYLKYTGPAIRNRNICINDTDFATLEPINKIPYNQFYSFYDKEMNVYGCDIISLSELLSNTNTSNIEKAVLNPYNREPIEKSSINEFTRYLKFAKLAKIQHEIENEVEIIDPTKQLEMKIVALFQYINELGNYTDSKWFSNLPRHMVVLFIREVYDIWYYRAQLTPALMREIVPPHGNPFLGLQLHLAQNQTYDALIKTAIRIIEYLVKSGHNNEDRSLGAYYVLSALTLVSEEARDSLPWLYQSVAH
jgi:hypothetical protein